MSKSKPIVSSPVQPGSVLHRLLVLIACYIADGLGRDVNLKMGRTSPSRRITPDGEDHDQP
jgi:hypothetical protein